MFSILYSLAGGCLSLAAMAVLRKRESFSVMGVSIAGGVFHNIGQLLMAILVTESCNLVYYLPVLLISGLVTGVLIGVTANEMLKRLTGIQL